MTSLIPEVFTVSYQKNDNTELFKQMDDILNVYNLQNYIPIYSRYFELNDTNNNSINLNQKNSIVSLDEKITDNIFNIKVINDNNKHIRKSFFKFSPLFDPVKYMVGKYSHIDKEKMKRLPKYNETEGYTKKVLDVNNTSYVDSFFSYLSSTLLHKHGFLHGIDFYGSFLAIQDKHFMNIFDDLEYLYGSDYFHANKDELFNTEDIDEDMLDDDTRSHRKKIQVKSGKICIETDEIDLGIKVENLTETNVRKHNSDNLDNSDNLKKEPSLKLCEHNIKVKSSNESSDSKKTNSTCSSRSSNTSKNSDETEETGDDGSDTRTSSLESCTNSNLSDYSSSGSEYIKAEVYDFPVQIICLEGLTNTLDSLLEVEDEDDEMDTLEWNSCLFQIIISLIVYQKSFQFTHNDLHSNNIMYIETDRQYLYYKLNDEYYKVPTFGKIFKIIDFGRGIYKHSGKTFCCDSFSPKGDASSQYNCEPYLNQNKPRLEPNKSFDLCRLACSLFDYFFDDIEEVKKETDMIALLIADLCKDDKGRNMLYKNNGEERYPDFKLYKMIARSVHKHNPEDVIKHSLFEKYVVTRKKIKKVKKDKIMNIDEFPSYV
jgi:hypothetical protein